MSLEVKLLKSSKVALHCFTVLTYFPYTPKPPLSWQVKYPTAQEKGRGLSSYLTTTALDASGCK